MTPLPGSNVDRLRRIRERRDRAQSQPWHVHPYIPAGHQHPARPAGHEHVAAQYGAGRRTAEAPTWREMAPRAFDPTLSIDERKAALAEASERVYGDWHQHPGHPRHRHPGPRYHQHQWRA